jgi:hypothetical protein
MAFGADHEVEGLGTSLLEEDRNCGWVQVEVGVDVRDPRTRGRERARLDRVALTKVAVVMDDPSPVRLIRQ